MGCIGRYLKERLGRSSSKKARRCNEHPVKLGEEESHKPLSSNLPKLRELVAGLAAKRRGAGQIHADKTKCRTPADVKLPGGVHNINEGTSDDWASEADTDSLASTICSSSLGSSAPASPRQAPQGPGRFGLNLQGVKDLSPEVYLPALEDQHAKAAEHTMDRFHGQSIFLGGQGAACNRELLRENNITHVITVNGGQGQASDVPHLDLVDAYVTLNLRDEIGENLTRHVAVVTAVMKAALESGGTVLVHCQKGRSRSAAFVVAYLMKEAEGGLTFEEALAVVKQTRHSADPNPGFCRQLLALQH